MDPDRLTVELPEGVRPVPASAVDDLHPSLGNVIRSQPEFAAWTPSRLCLLYFGRMEAGGRRIRQEQLRKAPMLGIWTVAAAGGSTASGRELALEMFTNHSGVEARGREAGLDLRNARTTVGPGPEDEDGRPSPNDRYTIRLGKAQVSWEGRAAEDTSAMTAPLALQWRAPGRRGGWVEAALSLEARTTGGMIGSLKVQGKGDLARTLQESPIRFVGPGYRGGGGSLRFGP